MAEKILHEDVQRKFACDQCVREFKYKRNLKRHFKDTHLNRPYFSCIYEHCERKFKRKDYIKTHLIKVHKLNPETAKEMMREDYYAEMGGYILDVEHVIVEENERMDRHELEMINNDNLEQIDEREVSQILHELEK